MPEDVHPFKSDDGGYLFINLHAVMYAEPYDRDVADALQLHDVTKWELTLINGKVLRLEATADKIKTLFRAEGA